MNIKQSLYFLPERPILRNRAVRKGRLIFKKKNKKLGRGRHITLSELRNPAWASIPISFCWCNTGRYYFLFLMLARVTMHQLYLRLLLLEYKYLCTVSAPSRKKSETKCSGQAGKKEVLVLIEPLQHIYYFSCHPTMLRHDLQHWSLITLPKEENLGNNHWFHSGHKCKARY